MKKDDLVIYKKMTTLYFFKKPKYESWLAYAAWDETIAGILLNGIDPLELVNHTCSMLEGFNGMGFNSIWLNEAQQDCFAMVKDKDFKSIHAFMKNILTEIQMIKTWLKNGLPPTPLCLINRYLLLNVGIIPEEMLKIAKRYFLGLYQNMEVDEKTATYWKAHWSGNVAAQFQELIINKNNVLKDNKLQKELEIISKETVQARENRIRKKGGEVYKTLKEKYPNKKITKKDIAKQIVDNEKPLYELLSKTQPTKKQPAIGTYLKDLRINTIKFKK